MTRNIQSRWGIATLVLALCVGFSSANAEVIRLSLVNSCDSCGTSADCCSACTSCPSCHARCKLEVKKVDEKKSCFKVECKTICIPKVRLPWQKCCEPLCAKTKTVKVLKKHSYTCPKCEYQWSVVECGSDCTDGEADAVVPSPAPAAPAPAASASYRYFSGDSVAR